MIILLTSRAPLFFFAMIKFIKAYPGIPVLVALYLIAIALVGIPRAPICDAWAYGKIVKNFLETGSIQFVGYGAMNLVFHILWGALFCLLSGGFSFTTLALSTIVLSFVASVVFYLILKRLVPKEPIATLASCLLICNPIFFVCSFSYMTDVPFICWMLLSILFYLKSFNENSVAYIVLGSIFGIIAFLIRQQGICVIAAACACYFLSAKQRNRLNASRLFALVILPALSIAMFLLWQRGHANVDKVHLFIRSPREVLFVLEYCSLFCLPLIVAYALRKNSLFIFGASFVIVTGNLLFSLFKEGKTMPYLPAWLTEYGVFTDQIIVGHRDFVLSPQVWLWITLITAVGSVFFLSLVFSRLRALPGVFLTSLRAEKRLIGILLFIGCASAFIFALFTVMRSALFRIYTTCYDYLYSIQYVKKPFAQNYYKIVSIHNSVIMWSSLAALICFGVFLMLRRSRSKDIPGKNSMPRVFSLASFLVYLVTVFQILLIFLIKYSSDRYLILLIPGSALFIVQSAQCRRYAHVICGFLLCVFFSYSVLVASDTYAWNDAAWRGGDYLVGRGIDRRQIDAGLAWNGWHFPKPISSDLDLITPRSKKITTWYLAGMFTEIDNEYTVSSSALEGYAVLSRIPYHSLLEILTHRKKDIYILKRS